MSSTLLRGLERELLLEFGKQLARFGFSQRPKDQVFCRPLTGEHTGYAALHLAFIEHEQDFDVTVDVAIRFDAIEELVNRDNTFITKKERGETCTLGVELGNFGDGRPYRVSVAGSDDVPLAIERLLRKVESVGLPYLDRFCTLEAAYEALSRDDRDGWIHSPIDAKRAKSTCALLTLLGRAPEIPAVAERKLAFMAAKKDPQAPGFSKFVAGLIK